jgi:hypothetical protein
MWINRASSKDERRAIKALLWPWMNWFVAQTSPRNALYCKGMEWSYRDSNPEFHHAMVA